MMISESTSDVSPTRAATTQGSERLAERLGASIPSNKRLTAGIGFPPTGRPIAPYQRPLESSTRTPVLPSRWIAVPSRLDA
jgi:hypothetical protein